MIRQDGSPPLDRDSLLSWCQLCHRLNHLIVEMSSKTDLQNLASQQLEGLNILLEVTNQLAHASDLHSILTTVTDAVCRALHCERASLFLYDKKKKGEK